VSRPAVSVVIPTRNRADLLALTLQSVLAQLAVAIEVIVVDDGGGPETGTLLDSIRDPRVRSIRTDQCRGVSSARNAGVALAGCEWVAFCDDDDLWAPRKLAMQLSAAVEESAAWAYGGEVTVDADLRVQSGGPPPPPDAVVRDLRHHNAVPAGASNVVVHRDALARAGSFDPALQTSEDWDLWLRLARTGGPPACIPRPLVGLRIHRAMASRNLRRVLEDVEVIARRHGIPVDRARHYRWAAWMALEDGDRGQALRHYARAVEAGDWRSAGRAVVAFVDPHVVRRRRLPEIDPWAVEAQQWLDVLRQTAATAGIQQR
jgi:glycosyltransferase involved in cell wall biosynthesis